MGEDHAGTTPLSPHLSQGATRTRLLTGCLLTLITWLSSYRSAFSVKLEFATDRLPVRFSLTPSVLRSLEGSCAQLPARPPNRLFLSAWTYGCFTLCFDTAPLYAVSKGRQLWLTRAFPAGPGALPQPHGAASSRPSFLAAPHDAPGSSHAPLSPVLAPASSPGSPASSYWRMLSAWDLGARYVPDLTKQPSLGFNSLPLGRSHA